MHIVSEDPGNEPDHEILVSNAYARSQGSERPVHNLTRDFAKSRRR